MIKEPAAFSYYIPGVSPVPPMTSPITIYGQCTVSRDLLLIEQFTNIEFGSVRTTMYKGDVYMSYNDICNCVEMKNHADQIKRFLDEDYRIVNENRGYYEQRPIPYVTIEVETDCGKFGTRNRDTLFIHENALYKILFRCNATKARLFTDWVACDLLPKLKNYNLDRRLMPIAYMACQDVIDDINSTVHDNKDAIEYITNMLDKNTEKLDKKLDETYNNVTNTCYKVGYDMGAVTRDNQQLSDLANMQQAQILGSISRLEGATRELGKEVAPYLFRPVDCTIV